MKRCDVCEVWSNAVEILLYEIEMGKYLIIGMQVVIVKGCKFENGHQQHEFEVGEAITVDDEDVLEHPFFHHLQWLLQPIGFHYNF